MGPVGSPADALRAPANVNLQGFQFAYRHGLFDWRLLHGIDVDLVVRPQLSRLRILHCHYSTAVTAMGNTNCFSSSGEAYRCPGGRGLFGYASAWWL